MVRHSQPLFQPKHLRGKDGEVELAAKAYNVPWMVLLYYRLIIRVYNKKGFGL